MSQIKQYLLDSNTSYLGLSETWLTDNIPDSMLYVPGYHLIRLDRRWLNLRGQVKKGGGVCCYINNDLKFSYLELNELNCSNQNGEILHVIIEQPFIKKCIIINVYRPPQGNVDLFTEKIIDNITDLNIKYPNAEIILLGDFNLNTLTKNSNDAQQVKWIE